MWCSFLKDIFILKQATLRDEELDVVVDRENHELPVNYIENTAFHCDDEVCGISTGHHVVQCVRAWILDLKILGRNEKTYQRDQQGIIISDSPHLWWINVHEVDCVVDRLVITLKAFSYVAQVVDSLDSFLYYEKNILISNWFNLPQKIQNFKLNWISKIWPSNWKYWSIYMAKYESDIHYWIHSYGGILVCISVHCLQCDGLNWIIDHYIRNELAKLLTVR